MLHAWFNKNSNYDAWLVSKPENIYYLTGFWGSFGLVWWEKSGKKHLITDGRYAETAAPLAAKHDFELVIYDAHFAKDWATKKSGKVAAEEHLTMMDFRRWQKVFKNADLEALPSAVDLLRQVKSEHEIELITAAQAHVDSLLLPFLKQHLRTGITEAELNFKLAQALQANGRYGLSFPSIVAFSEHSSRPHHVSSDRPLKPGDNILIDCGVTHEHYASDMTRNFVFGTPADAEYVPAYAKLLEAQQQTQTLFTAGTKVAEIEKRCRDLLGSEAEYFTHALGHGVGLEIHEAPTVSGRSKAILQAREVVTNEPGLYYPDRFGIRIEDLLVVTEGKPRILSQCSRDCLSLAEDGSVQILHQAP